MFQFNLRKILAPAKYEAVIGDWDILSRPFDYMRTK